MGNTQDNTGQQGYNIPEDLGFLFQDSKCLQSTLGYRLEGCLDDLQDSCGCRGQRQDGLYCAEVAGMPWTRRDCEGLEMHNSQLICGPQRTRLAQVGTLLLLQIILVLDEILQVAVDRLTGQKAKKTAKGTGLLCMFS
jgi:hypothetical protein